MQVVVLYVDEATSIQRQLQRAVAARAHNARILDAGVGERLHQERATDLDLRKAASRYQLFKSHYSAILRLKQFFAF
jgi:adenylate kinase